MATSDQKLARLSLPEKTRMFAMAYIASGRDIVYAERKAHITSGRRLLSDPIVQQYISLLEEVQRDACGIEREEMQKVVMTRREVGVFLTAVINGEYPLVSREQLSAAKMLLSAFGDNDGAVGEIATIKSLGMQAEEEVG